MIYSTSRRFKTYKSRWEIASIILGLIFALAAFDRYVDWRIDQKLSDEALLKKIGMTARPFCIFNSKGSVLFDSGAMKFIGYPGKNPIDLSDVGKDGRAGHITIHFNQLFTYPPTLTVIGAGLDTSKPERGPGYDWTYTMYSTSALTDEASKSPPMTGEQDYKLEILY